MSIILVLIYALPASAISEAIPPTSETPLRIITGFQKNHLGIDMSADIGSPIKAVASGNVSWVGSLPNGLGCVSIEHENGLRTTYMPVRIDDTLSGWRSSSLYVSAGDLIGFLEDGDKSSSEPHLHLGLKTGHGSGVQYFNPLEELDFQKYTETIESSVNPIDSAPIADERQVLTELPMESLPQTINIVDDSAAPAASTQQPYNEIIPNNTESTPIIEQQMLSLTKQDPVTQVQPMTSTEIACAPSPSSAAPDSPVLLEENVSHKYPASVPTPTKAHRRFRFERMQRICDMRQLSDISSTKISDYASTYKPTNNAVGSKGGQGSQKASPFTTSTLFLLAASVICARGLKSFISICFGPDNLFRNGMTTHRFFVRPPPVPV